MPVVGVALLLLAVVVIVLTSPLGQGLRAWTATTPHQGPPSSADHQGGTVGTIAFESSGWPSPATGQGILDELKIDLSPIATPAADTSYYGWLLPANTGRAQPKAVVLGALPVRGGAIHFLYTDSLHRNLLGLAGEFLITEEAQGAASGQPTPDQAAWRYRADFPQITDPAHHAALLDLLQRLLVEDPTLASLGLHGGLDAWFLRNIQQVFESAGAARDYFGQEQALPLLRLHLALVLDYLDGAGAARLDLGAHPAASLPFGAQVGLLQVAGAGAGPPALLSDLDLHLKGVIAAAGATAAQRQFAAEVDGMLTGIAGWLRQLRIDTRQLASMTNAQMLQPQAQSLLDDADTCAQYALGGQPDPSGTEIKGGVTQMHYALLRLAAFQVGALQLL
jgi:hypothetical protein